MKTNYIFVSHDLGGAEAINTYIKYKNINPLVIASGPAKVILSKYENINFGNLDSFITKYLVNGNFEIIFGTGWGDYEIKWMERLSNKNIKFSVIFDNWIFFKERLTLKKVNTMIEPEKIYLLDDEAYDQAVSLLKLSKTKIVNLKIIKEYSNLKKINKEIKIDMNYRIRYISQPLYELSFSSKSLKNPRFKIPELDQHKTFMDLVNILLPELNCKFSKIIINPHPSEDKLSLKKWNLLVKELSYKSINIEKFDTQKVKDFELVFGFNSLALLKASLRSYMSFSLCDFVSWTEKLPHKTINNL